ncbi:PREDICTED: sodium channel protein Nach-like [Papilio xuthus]|uniref:Sodium channel protein Nach-like n=1 Tax=Papilio xuthus TaxID=66420 RepID=A0AAJ6ZRC6_PAPXU|nr:PREDICTED: sodium channel protein Nach-like [Papilio xuthus]
MIWNKFIIDPTFTVVETTHYPTSKIPFPAVIVCDTEMVYGPSTNNIKDILRLRGFQNEQIDDFFRSLTDIKLIGYEIQPHVKKMHSILESLGYTYNDLLNTFKKPCEVLIEKCVWRSKLINCSEMFRTVLTYLGYCCKFDLTYFSLHAEEGTNFAGGTEITEGLDITVNTDKYFSSGNKSDGYASLYVIDKDDKITILDNAITITSGAYFDATITVWLMDSSADVKALSLSNRKCFLDTDLKTGATSYQNCMMNLVMKKIIEYCQCIPFNFEASILSVEDFPACSWGRLNCVYDSLEFIQGNIREVVSHNDCYQNCDYIEYETEVEYLKRDRTIRIPRTNSRVTVHFEDNSCMKYRREVLYTWDQMLGMYW